MKALLTAILILVGLPKLALAQATQFYLEDMIDKWKVRIYVVGDAQAKNQIQEALYHAVDHAREALSKFDANNPSSELGGINQKKVKGSFMVSAELAKAVDAALDVSKRTNGVFDITSESKEGTFKNVSVNRKNNELKIKADNININLRYVLRGVLADLIAEDLTNAGWKNCLIKLGNIFAARGNDVSGPWKIPVVTPTDKFAKRAFYYKAIDVSAATLTTNDGAIDVVDPKTKSQVQSNLKSVTIFTQSAAKAEGLATAVYTMGLEEGKKFLAKNSNLRAVLGDQQGNFTHIPEFRPNP